MEQRKPSSSYSSSLLSSLSSSLSLLFSFFYTVALRMSWVAFHRTRLGMKQIPFSLLWIMEDKTKTWRRKVPIAHDSSFDKKSFSGARGSSHKCLICFALFSCLFPSSKINEITLTGVLTNKNKQKKVNWPLIFGSTCRCFMLSSFSSYLLFDTPVFILMYYFERFLLR